MSLLLLRKTDTLSATQPHKSTQTLHWYLQCNNTTQHNTTEQTHTHRQKEEHAFSPCQGHSTSIAAMIIMISSNEQATGVNTTHPFSFNTACYYHFFVSDTYTCLIYHVILSQSQSCHASLSPAWQRWGGRPKSELWTQKTSGWVAHYGTAGVAVQLMRSVTPPANCGMVSKVQIIFFLQFLRCLVLRYEWWKLS